MDVPFPLFLPPLPSPEEKRGMAVGRGAGVFGEVGMAETGCSVLVDVVPLLLRLGQGVLSTTQPGQTLLCCTPFSWLYL